MRFKGLLLVGLGLGFFVWGYLITLRGSDLPQGKLNVLVAPAEANVLLDGSSIKSGERYVDIGPHKIKITMSGFKSYENIVNITQADETYVGVILDPNSPNTKDWFEDHPDDQKLSEGINDQQVDSSSAEVTRKYPIFVRLPVVFGNGAGGLTKIGSEAALNNSGKPSIGIYASTPGQRQQALDWISNRNYTISDLDVVFYGAQIPLNSEIPR